MNSNFVTLEIKDEELFLMTAVTDASPSQPWFLFEEDELVADSRLSKLWSLFQKHEVIQGGHSLLTNSNEISMLRHLVMVLCIDSGCKMYNV